MTDLSSLPIEAMNAMHVLQDSFAESLVALYLHGSAVTGGLRPHSDVDLLAVIRQPMNRDIRIQLANRLMAISGNPTENGPVRPVEVIVFLAADLTVPQYPARCEFIYGEWLRGDFEAGVIPEPLCDPEMTLILAQAQQEAWVIIGPEATTLLPAIPHADVRRAIADALPLLLANLEGDERNVVLTLARMLRTVSCGDFVSKDVAAQWASSHIPEGHADILLKARAEYLGVSENAMADCWQEVCETIDTLRKLIEHRLA